MLNGINRSKAVLASKSPERGGAADPARRKNFDELE
jgi:hypothetical protein